MENELLTDKEAEKIEVPCKTTACPHPERECTVCYLLTGAQAQIEKSRRQAAAMTPEKLREEVAGLRHYCNRCSHWQEDCFQDDWVVEEGLCTGMVDSILAIVTPALIQQGRQ